MAEGRRRTRSWGPLYGASEDANTLARLLRSWLDRAGLSLRELVGALQPEHFRDKHVPSRTTISQRLAGANPQWDFVEAVADVCSRNGAERSRMLDEARPAWERLCTARGEDREEAAPDPLRRALARAAVAERERGEWHQMSVVLLSRVGTLERDLAALREGASGAGAGRGGECLPRWARRELERSEAERERLAAELRRTRTRPDGRTVPAPVRADGPDSRDRATDCTPYSPRKSPLAAALSLTEARDHRRDEEAQRGALAVGRDSTPGYVQRVLALLDADGRPEEFDLVLSAVVRERPAPLVPAVLTAFGKAHRDLDATRLRTSLARVRPAQRVLDVLTALRDDMKYTDAYQILSAAGRMRPVADIPPLVKVLREEGRLDDISWLMQSAGRDRSPTEARALAEILRRAGEGEAAELLLDKLEESGRVPVPTPEPVPGTGSTTDGGQLSAAMDLATALVPVRAPVLGRRFAPGAYVRRVRPPRP
ncbi:hypothetical protein [Streptomyces luteireticuli]|uniref:hypothetical protein n=1 Tax=Streptomyces luteireticuli TaxID=173858 RepID=UPI003556420C